MKASGTKETRTRETRRISFRIHAIRKAETPEQKIVLSGSEKVVVRGVRKDLEDQEKKRTRKDRT